MGGLVPWTQRLREMVRNGPSPFDRVLAEMAAQVPPGRGFRDALSRSDWSRNKRGLEAIERELNETEKTALIRQGRHRIAYQTIWTQKRAGVVDVYEDDGVKMVMRGPRFSDKEK